MKGASDLLYEAQYGGQSIAAEAQKNSKNDDKVMARTLLRASGQRLGKVTISWSSKLKIRIAL